MIKLIVRQSQGNSSTAYELPPVVMEEVTDPVELAKARAQRERYDRNSAWLQAHAHEVFSKPKHRGKYLVISGEELFVADTIAQAIDLADNAHPEDDGSFIHYLPKENIPRIYAHSR